MTFGLLIWLKIILTVIDLYTKFTLAIPLKNKTFENILDRISKKLYADMSKELLLWWQKCNFK